MDLKLEHAEMELDVASYLMDINNLNDIIISTIEDGYLLERRKID